MICGAGRKILVSNPVSALLLSGMLGSLLPNTLPARLATTVRDHLPRTLSGTMLGHEVITLRAPGSLMVRIPEGRFVLGSSPEEVLDAAASCAAEPLGHRCSEQTFANELGRRVLYLDAYWIDRLEVSVQEYARCVSAGRCLSLRLSAGARRFMRPDYPATFVSFQDANDYCKFRGARLPSEFEFERAARGTTGRRYPWGNLYNPRVANHGRYALLSSDESDGYAELSPVGQYPAGRTPEGILDLAGNASEWVQDVYRERYADPLPAAGTRTRHTVRGGSWTSGAAWLRGAARDSAPAETRRPDLGFRCAKSVTVSASLAP